MCFTLRALFSFRNVLDGGVGENHFLAISEKYKVMWMGVTYDEHASGIRLEQHEYIGENVCVTTRTFDTGLRFQYWNCWVGGNWKRFKFKGV